MVVRMEECQLLKAVSEISAQRSQSYFSNLTATESHHRARETC